MKPLKARQLTYLMALTGLVAGPALAADGFKLRFPLSGTLGGEIVAPANNPGFFGSVVVTSISVDKVSGEDGNVIKVPQVGTVPFSSAQVPGGPRTATYSGQFELGVTQKQTNTNLLLGYLSEGDYNGGKLLATINLPFGSLDRTVNLSGPTPTLTALTPALSPPLPAANAAAIQAQVQAGFATNYQASLANQSVSATGTSNGLGDAELTGAWVYSKDGTKVIAGATLAMPTAKYDKNSTLNLGFGNYYTLRPGIAASTSVSDKVTLGGRASLGFNSGNVDNGIRTGNFAALDLALAVRTPIGVVGPHFMYVTQYEADQGGTLGDNKFSATGAGAFFTTLIPNIGVAVNFAYMKMLDSKNALTGSFLQVRATKAF